MKVIGLSGKAGSGKDYVAHTYLKSLGFWPIGLADAIKELAVTQGICTYEEAFLTKPPAVRTLLQVLGVEQGRALWGEDCWCRGVEARMRVVAERWGHEKFVITDVRFLNEVQFVQEVLKGEVYRLYAPDRVADVLLTEEQREHVSETALDRFDVITEDLENGVQRFATTVVEVHNERASENALFDAVIDNRRNTSVSLDTQMTQILRAHDHIQPNDWVFSLPPGLG